MGVTGTLNTPIIQWDESIVFTWYVPWEPQDYFIKGWLYYTSKDNFYVGNSVTLCLCELLCSCQQQRDLSLITVSRANNTQDWKPEIKRWYPNRHTGWITIPLLWLDQFGQNTVIFFFILLILLLSNTSSRRNWKQCSPTPKFLHKSPPNIPAPAMP